MIDIVLIIVIALSVILAIRHIIVAKKNRATCIGCSSCNSCNSCSKER